MSQEPLITRSELRKRKEEQQKEQMQIEKTAKKEYERKEKEIDNFYRKQTKKQPPLKKTRTEEKAKSQRISNTLTKWIVIVFCLLVAVLLMVFFW
ncbi:MAG: hypothetical protein GX180_00655 [Enterococcus sp.]|nr:hypothetical protein [Enterococcus sp.]